MATMTGMTPQQLAIMLQGTDAMAMPSYSIQSIYDGILPSLPPPPMAQFGPVQGSKVNRGQPSEFYQPPTTTADTIAYRQPSTTRLAASQPPPAKYGTPSAFASDPNFIARERSPNGEYSDPLQALAEITINGGNRQAPVAVPRVPMPRPFSLASAVGLDFGGAPMLTDDDPWGGLRVGGSKGANRPGMATGTPSGSKAAAQPQKKSFSLFDALMNMGGNPSSGPISVPGGNPNITYTDPGIVNPGSGKEINGIDIAFMPKAVQQSSRWNTGY